MKGLYTYLMTLMVLTGCQNPDNDTVGPDVYSNNHYAKEDTVYISTSPTLEYYVLKEEYNKLVQQRKEFFSDSLNAPDFTYHSSYDSFEDITFKSETGQDYYYLCYTYFLKKRNNHENYHGERERLIDLYNSINHIYSIIARGGTFFSHNKPRIQAYAEWDIYNYLVAKRAVPISEIDFESEKEAFIERNRKILESSNSFEYWDSFTEEERKATLQELQVLFESLSEKIDTPFYLSCVLGFEERYQHLISVQ
jgi:hypothetical protein